MQKPTKSPPRAQSLTTGQAAELCSVSRDTVLKWVKSGLVPARRTKGGHFRIARRDLAEMIDPAAPAEGPAERRFQYCWEFHSGDGAIDACRDCVVYRLRAQRCYRVVEQGSEIGHRGVFCERSCNECGYYQALHSRPANVLVITDNELLAASLRRRSEATSFDLRVTDCEYQCSLILGDFTPDYVVLDCGFGLERAREMCRNLRDDPRLPHTRVILATDSAEQPDCCDDGVFARITKPFGAAEISECLGLDGRDRMTAQPPTATKKEPPG